MTATLIQSSNPADAAPAAAKSGVVTEELNLARARVAARTAGHRVEAVSERSETSTTWVNPNGTLTIEVAAGPIRFYDQSARAWRGVDVALGHAPDGSVASKAHPQGLKVAAGSLPRMAKATPQAAPSVTSSSTRATASTSTPPSSPPITVDGSTWPSTADPPTPHWTTPSPATSALPNRSSRSS